MAQSRESKSLFDLPPELRVFVYQYYFSDDELHRHGYFKITQIVPKLLRTKTPLLQSNQVVLTEALPVFYHHYLFQIQVPTPGIPIFPSECPTKLRRSEDIIYLAPALPLITRMDLAEPYPLSIYGWNRKMAPFLECLCNYCPKLRFLRLDFMGYPTPLPWRIFARESCKSESIALLIQLAQRLDHLQIIFFYMQGYETVELCKSIAPEAYWAKDTSSKFTSVWSFHRGAKAMEDTLISQPPADGAAIS